MSQALAQVENQAVALTNAAYLSPALSVVEAVERQKYLQEVVGKLLVQAPAPDRWGNVNLQGADYGTLPGTKERTLFQNGAEKLALFFGLNIHLNQQQATEDWDNGFFFYRYRATAYHNGVELGNIERTCHTKEEKYRWVWVECPRPDQATVDAKKADKTGRLKQIWKDGRKTNDWAWQEKRQNPDPYSLQNTVMAMAEKRAKVAIVKHVLAATGFFSKEIDFENYKDEMPQDEAPDYEQPAPRQAAKPTNGGAQKAEVPKLSPEEAHINGALISHFVREKGEKAGQAYFDGVWKSKPLVERKKEAERLGLLGKPAETSQVIDAEIVEEPETPRSTLLGIIKEIKAKLSKLPPDEKRQTPEQQIEAKIKELCDNQADIAKLDDNDIGYLIQDFGRWYDALIAEEEA